MAKAAKRKVGTADSTGEVTSNPSGGAADKTSASFTARMQREHLEAAVRDWDLGIESDDDEVVPIKQTPLPGSEEPPSPTESSRKLILGALAFLKTSRFLKSGLALLAVLALGWVPVQRLLATTSAEAVVNARLITVRAPISGNILPAFASLEPGTAFRAGAELLSIKNPNLDRSNLDNLNRTVETLSTDVASLRAKATVLKRHKAELAVQVQRFREGRIETLERAVDALNAQIAAAAAQHDQAEKVLARTHNLFEKKVTTEANFDSAVRDESVAAQNVSQLQQQRQAAEIELASARKGVFIADGYNDIPQAEQRSLDVELQLADVAARLSGTVKELQTAKEAHAQEEKRTHALSLAVIRPSVSGRIWEELTAPGEHVNAGQVLMRLLDCNSVVVTASVSESVFEKLTIGQRATFKPSDGGPLLEGWIADISGMASVISNDAIQPKLLTREPYHVTLKFPGLARQSECQISHPGLVTFGRASPVESALVHLSDMK